MKFRSYRAETKWSPVFFHNIEALLIIPEFSPRNIQKKGSSRMEIIDLSLTLEDNRKRAPWWARNTVKNQSHAFGSLAVWVLFRLRPKHMRSGTGWANDEIKLSTHGTTHLDAPWHFAPTSEGKPARTIDLIPLEWCFSDGVVLDMTHKKSNEKIEIPDLELALEKISYRIKPMDIVLIRTDNDKISHKKEYFSKGPGVSAEATKWILDHGVKITGIDSWGWDIPLHIQAAEARITGRQDVFWEAHFVGMDKEYCHLERLANLRSLPSQGFKIACFPLKVKNGSAGPARVAGILDRNQTIL